MHNCLTLKQNMLVYKSKKLVKRSVNKISFKKAASLLYYIIKRRYIRFNIYVSFCIINLIFTDRQKKHEEKSKFYIYIFLNIWILYQWWLIFARNEIKYFFLECNIGTASSITVLDATKNYRYGWKDCWICSAATDEWIFNL